MKGGEARQAAQALFGEAQRSPFGPISLGSETHRASTLPDAVRRCRWIAVDAGAEGFGLFTVSASLERPRLIPCFDEAFPGVSVATRFIAGSNGEELVHHARVSTVPCWWNDEGMTESVLTFCQLGWVRQIAPLVPGTSGIALPVHVEHGHSGVVTFTGPNIAMDEATLHEIHARCFALHGAVVRMRPAEGGKALTMSKRELECLTLTANGYTSSEIARLLRLSVHTANQYLTNCAQKLNAVNRTQAVAKALRLGLID